MAKNIQTGIDKIIKFHEKKQTELSNSQWRDIRNKVDSLLLRTNVLKTDEARKSCQALDTMDYDARVKYITEKWGPQYLAKVQPLLYQLRVLEKAIAGQKT